MYYIGDEYLQEHQSYRLATKEYIATGHDGYTVLATAEILADADQCLEVRLQNKPKSHYNLKICCLLQIHWYLQLSVAIQNHFHAIELVAGTGAVGSVSHKHSRHHQSLITLSRRHSLLRSMSAIHDMSNPSQLLERCNSLSPRPSLSRQGNVVEEMEAQSCKLAPVVEGRIVAIKSKEVSSTKNTLATFYFINFCLDLKISFRFTL